MQRSLKFVKYLPEFGYDPLVLTSMPGKDEKWAPVDDSLRAELAETKVFSASIDSAPSRRQRKLANALGLRSPSGRAWARAAFQMGCQIIEQERPELIFISMSPFEGCEAAAALSQKYRIPWVADLRDPWALDEMQVYPSGLHRRIEKRRMRSSLSSAACVIMNTPESGARLLQEFPEFCGRRVANITNGYDGDDFSAPCSSANELFTIVHAGFLHTEAGLELRRKRKSFEALGRVCRNVDFLTRSHYFLVQGLEKWLQRRPDLVNSVRVRFVGSKSAADEGIIQSDQLRQVCSFEGYLPHRKSVEAIRTASLLFLPMHNLPSGQRATIVPGKTYEYMATGRPILAAVPDGDAKDFLARSNLAEFVQPDSPGAFCSALDKCYENWVDKRELSPDWNYIAGFERKALTARLAMEVSSVSESKNASRHFAHSVV